MSEALKGNVVEGEFKDVQSPEASGTESNDEIEVKAEVSISVMSNGEIRLNISEAYEKLAPAQVEGIVKSVYEQLHDQRIVNSALEAIKAKLG